MVRKDPGIREMLKMIGRGRGVGERGDKRLYRGVGLSLVGDGFLAVICVSGPVSLIPLGAE